jgi:hypothetical protein
MHLAFLPHIDLVMQGTAAGKHASIPHKKAARAQPKVRSAYFVPRIKIKSEVGIPSMKSRVFMDGMPKLMLPSIKMGVFVDRQKTIFTLENSDASF